MYSTNLRKVGGSVMLTILPNFLDLLHLRSGEAVNMVIKDNQLVIEPEKTHYTLKELMAQCDLSQPLSTDEQQWLDDSSLGNEAI